MCAFKVFAQNKAQNMPAKLPVNERFSRVDGQRFAGLRIKDCRFRVVVL
jgi:hypothetical protein